MRVWPPKTATHGGTPATAARPAPSSPRPPARRRGPPHTSPPAPCGARWSPGRPAPGRGRGGPSDRSREEALQPYVPSRVKGKRGISVTDSVAEGALGKWVASECTNTGAHLQNKGKKTPMWNENLINADQSENFSFRGNSSLGSPAEKGKLQDHINENCKHK